MTREKIENRFLIVFAIIMIIGILLITCHFNGYILADYNFLIVMLAAVSVSSFCGILFILSMKYAINSSQSVKGGK